MRVKGDRAMLNMEVNGTKIQIELCDNSSARAVEGLLKDSPLTIDMMDYAHMEKFGRLKQNLPTNDEYITTKAGDVILSEGNLLVLYYAPNTWTFTRLGRVKNLSEPELKKALGKGNIRAVFSMGERQKSRMDYRKQENCE